MASRTPTQRNTSRHALEIRKRQDRALALRLEGHGYERIAAELRYKSRGAAHDAVMAALNRQPAEDAKAVRAMELERLDELLRVAWEQVHMDHLMVDHGQVVMHEGAPVIDHAGKLAALDRVLRIMDRRAKLMGLDAPTRKVVEVVTEDVVEAEIARLEAQLAQFDQPTTSDPQP